MQTISVIKIFFSLHTKNNQRFRLIYSVVSMSFLLFADIIDGYSILSSFNRGQTNHFSLSQVTEFLNGSSIVEQDSYRIFFSAL